MWDLLGASKHVSYIATHYNLKQSMRFTGLISSNC